MADSSFDIVSKVDRQEVDNALNQAAKELATRFDFRGTDTTIAWKGDEVVEIVSSTEERAKAAVDVFKEKLVRRDISMKAFDAGDLATARAWHLKLFALCRDLLGLASNPIPIKAALAMVGRDTGDVRLPLVALEPAHADKLRRVIADYGLRPQPA